MDFYLYIAIDFVGPYLIHKRSPKKLKSLINFLVTITKDNKVFLYNVDHINDFQNRHSL